MSGATCGELLRCAPRLPGPGEHRVDRGGLFGAFPYPTFAEVKQQLAALRSSSPFPPVSLPFSPPLWATGALGEIGALLAERDPTGPSALQSFPRLSSYLAVTPSIPVTNRGIFGWLFDRKTSPLGPGCQVRSGRLATSGNPRDWVDHGITPSSVWPGCGARNRTLFTGTTPAAPARCPSRLRADPEPNHEAARPAHVASRAGERAVVRVSDVADERRRARRGESVHPHLEDPSTQLRAHRP
jgi:hypothetical protein